jgi:hypothetical protein
MASGHPEEYDSVPRLIDIAVADEKRGRSGRSSFFLTGQLAIGKPSAMPRTRRA